MTALWTAADAAAATGGKARGNWSVTGVSIDTRTIQPGDLFVALKAARDGHDFVAQALEKGAGAALVSHVPEGVPDNAPLLIVPDVLAALEALGTAARARTDAKVVAVTGSVGKTTTKEMLRTGLSALGKTHAAEASYNNHWGVPLTLARMPADTEFAVIEIGMNHPGEIAPLSRMARPHVGVITTVAAVHLEAFESVEGIAHEKAAIFEGLEPGGIAVINADLDTTPILHAKADDMGARVIAVGETGDARLVEVTLTDSATVVKADLHGTDLLFKLDAPGRHLAQNALMVLAVVDALDRDVTRAMLALGSWQPVDGRGRRERIVINDTDEQAVELIDDAFNASPTSMAASLEVLAAATPQGRGRRIAVLGDMLELGPTGPDLHAGLAKLTALDNIDLVCTSGPLMAHLDAALPAAKRGPHTETAEEMARLLPGLLWPGDIVLIKSSKGSKLSLAVDGLRKLGQAARQSKEDPR
ncbi:UDP-N-acetylmuramoyl-tripeptide--D-alanyl-D-alanine ligase [Nioella sediminis]|jgi:UDP-N-acetylmuramoyl-tripeptide--D-alanyl-D-alanine ligase|uniref:UDP-N-acetylmuramoyl-tripeptide--D-alanyl-D- alanine ligase n=1 Tax=Nioella sediminis TaxID=1912092 RepID=UPI0008FCF994|nr:UDP-N-acetylmuramoyl-tripeptide--D-alanyl-D-alanine ligase [Nioella sediminis]TBX27633.1 UDP-N-acetylmuramoyl-tripeptide--D-alanyl-D-alanine ligase [Roseovarius sp. JS7-11]